MGGLCSKGSAVDKSPSESTLNANNYRDHEPVDSHSRLKTQNNSIGEQYFGESKEKWLPQPPLSFSDRMMPAVLAGVSSDVVEGIEPQLSRSLSHNSRLTTSKLAATSKAGTTKVIFFFFLILHVL